MVATKAEGDEPPRGSVVLGLDHEMRHGLGDRVNYDTGYLAARSVLAVDLGPDFNCHCLGHDYLS
jgi:hypothetical protein